MLLPLLPFPVSFIQIVFPWFLGKDTIWIPRSNIYLTTSLLHYWSRDCFPSRETTERTEQRKFQRVFEIFGNTPSEYSPWTSSESSFFWYWKQSRLASRRSTNASGRNIWKLRKWIQSQNWRKCSTRYANMLSSSGHPFYSKSCIAFEFNFADGWFHDSDWKTRRMHSQNLSTCSPMQILPLQMYSLWEWSSPKPSHSQALRSTLSCEIWQKWKQDS